MCFSGLDRRAQVLLNRTYMQNSNAKHAPDKCGRCDPASIDGAGVSVSPDALVDRVNGNPKLTSCPRTQSGAVVSIQLPSTDRASAVRHAREVAQLDVPHAFDAGVRQTALGLIADIDRIGSLDPCPLPPRYDTACP